ncbi:MAG TPA: multicopper oxidase domain-containing protein, partial [Acidimicrobiales bacterium]
MRRPDLGRRNFLKGASALGGSALAVGGMSRITPQAHDHTHQTAGTPQSVGHGAMGTVGRVDPRRNGFDPHQILTDFDGGAVSRDASGRTVREYDIVAFEKQIEVAPGVFFPAWTYNGRVPGPTIRVTQGDRVRITFRNGSTHAHTIHF